MLIFAPKQVIFEGKLTVYKKTPQIEFCGGDYTGVVPPVPISNTEVKSSKANGSALR